MKISSNDEYFRPKTYFGYLWEKSRNGGLLQIFFSVYKKIRKYTLVSGIFKTFAIIITLLEKSAVLLLIATCILLILPVILFLLLLYAAVCIVKYISIHKKIKAWLLSGENVTIFITKERIFSNNDDKLFLREAKLEASEYSHPVIVVCTDRFIAAKWYSLNLLAVRTDYYFIIKRYFLKKTNPKTTYIVL